MDSGFDPSRHLYFYFYFWDFLWRLKCLPYPTISLIIFSFFLAYISIISIFLNPFRLTPVFIFLRCRFIFTFKFILLFWKFSGSGVHFYYNCLLSLIIVWTFTLDLLFFFIISSLCLLIASILLFHL